MKKSIKTLALALATLGLVSACTIGGKSSNPASSASGSDSASQSGSQSSSASQSGSDSSSSSSSSQAGITLDEVLALAVQKAAAKKAKVNIPDYRDMEYLGPNTAVYTYLGTYASSGSVYYFVNEQGYFAYQYAGGELSLKTFELDPTIDLYSDVLYTPYDIINSNLSGASATLVEETESAFVADLVLTDDMKAALASLIGYGASYYSYVTATRMTISKDASTIDFDVTFNGASELAYVTNFGTHENAEAIAFIEAIPPYEPVVAWPADEIAAAFTAKGASLYDIPAFEGEGFSYVVDATSYSSFVDITVNGADADDLPAYKTVLETAGWTVTANSASNYTAKKAFADGIAKIVFAYSSSFGFYIDPYYAKEALPITAWPADLITAAFTAKGTTEFAVPALEGEGYQYAVNDSYVDSYGVFIVSVTGPAASDMPTYQAAFETAGWTVTYDSTEDEYMATKTLADGIARVMFYFYNGKANIQIYLVKDPLPTATWPTEDLATLFDTLGYTIALPEFAGEATGFQLFNNEYGTYVVVSVEEGTEAAAVASYQATLATATFVETWGDSYGDMRYVSPTGQYAVCVYSAEAGSVTIDFFNSPFSEEVPLADVNEFLEYYEFGFELTAAMFEGKDIQLFELAYGEDYYGYPNVSLSFAGDFEDAFIEILEPLILAAGFSGSNGSYSNSSWSSVEISESDGITTLLFQF